VAITDKNKAKLCKIEQNLTKKSKVEQRKGDFG